LTGFLDSNVLGHISFPPSKAVVFDRVCPDVLFLTVEWKPRPRRHLARPFRQFHYPCTTTSRRSDQVPPFPLPFIPLNSSPSPTRNSCPPQLPYRICVPHPCSYLSPTALSPPFLHAPDGFPKVGANRRLPPYDPTSCVFLPPPARIFFPLPLDSRFLSLPFPALTITR